jgi:dihydrofolate reductase
MAKLLYCAITSLDGYVADADGNWDWSIPDSEVHGFVNDLQRPIGTYLFGRRMYEVMVAWETMDDDHPTMRDYADIWKSAEKIVFSKTLKEVSSANTRIEEQFDPHAIKALKEQSPKDISIGGPRVAAHALRAALVDEIHLFMSPVIVGAGNPALPADLRLDLELLGQRSFGNGVVHVHYATR